MPLAVQLLHQLDFLKKKEMPYCGRHLRALCDFHVKFLPTTLLFVVGVFLRREDVSPIGNVC